MKRIFFTLTIVFLLAISFFYISASSAYSPMSESCQTDLVEPLVGGDTEVLVRDGDDGETVVIYDLSEAGGLVLGEGTLEGGGTCVAEAIIPVSPSLVAGHIIAAIASGGSSDTAVVVDAPTATPTLIATSTPPTPPPPPPTETPAVEYGLSINGGAISTTSGAITLSISAKWGTTEMMVSNDGGFSTSSWEPYTTTKSWVILGYGTFVIPRTVYIKFRDSAGNTTATYQDDIILAP